LPGRCGLGAAYSLGRHGVKGRAAEVNPSCRGASVSSSLPRAGRDIEEV